MGLDNATRLVSRSELSKLSDPNAFVWATGIEDTFVFDPHGKTGRALDEYELTGHYDRWREDLGLAAQLGVTAARYGIPWYKVSPAKGKWDWSFANDTLEALLGHGVDPIVDLVHYGTPGWMEDGFLNPDFPHHMAEYSAILAQKFKGRIRWYTPLNEPRITAHYCGRIGAWPPYKRGWSGFVKIMVAVCKGIVLTSKALGNVDPEIVKCHVDATDIFEASDPAHQAAADLRQSIVFLALDLITGKVDHHHSLYKFLLGNGMLQTDIDWFAEHPVELDVLGINLYPMFSLKRSKGTDTRVRFQMPYAADSSLVERLGMMYWERYQRPLMITETATVGTVARRQAWLRESVEDCKKLRAAGIPIVGYTWWPMFSLVGWNYRGSDRPLHKHFLHMGLWDLGEDLSRRSTPMVEAYRAVALGGAPGELSTKEAVLVP